MSEEGEGFLSRWSRRKRAVVEGRAPEEATPPAEAPPPVTVPEAEAEDDFDLASLPPVESLTLESDFKAFLHRKVPLDLRAAALRRAWSLDPAIRDFIGPADYAWDFNAPDGVPGFALELGGDAVKLLAHALGLDDRPKPLPVAAIEAEAEAATSELAALEPAPSANPALSIPAEAPNEPEADPIAATKPPRRHGGALPA